MRLTIGQRLVRWGLVLAGLLVVAGVALIRLLMTGGDEVA